MSFRALAWSMNVVRGLSPGAKTTLWALAEFSDNEDKTWRSREDLKWRVECSTRSLSTYLKELETRGLISQERRYAVCQDPEGGCANLRPGHKHCIGTMYRLNLDVALPVPASAPPSVRATQAVVEASRASQESTDANLAPVEVESTNATFALVDETLESRGNLHECNICMCGGGDESTDVNPGSPQMQPVASVGVKGINPQLNPHPDLTVTADADSDGLVGSGNDAASVAAGRAASTADAVFESSTAPAVVDRGLISECLPVALQALDAQGAVRVSDLLRERVDAGWKPSDIRGLMDRPLPEKVHRLSALVAKRLETNVDPALAPAPVEAVPVVRAEAVEQVPDPAETAWGQVFYAPVWEAEVVAADGNYLAAMKATQARLDEAYPTREEYARAWRTIADGRGETIPDSWWAAHPEELTTRAIEVGDEAIRNRREGAA